MNESCFELPIRSKTYDMYTSRKIAPLTMASLRAHRQHEAIPGDTTVPEHKS